jgi:signal transduction histidine kinase
LKPVTATSLLAEEHARAPASTRIAALLGVFAFVLFAFVDPFMGNAPPLAWLYATRLLVVSLLLALFASSHTPWGSERGGLLAALSCLVIGLGVIAVNVMVGGASTTYHEALLLNCLGFAVLPLPWRLPTYGMLFGGLTLSWLTAVMLTNTTGSSAQIASALAMLILGSVIATTLANLGRSMRQRDFDQRTQIAEANTRLSALDRAKSRFFANLSHEFRTPLTLALAPLESLLESNRGELTEMQVRHVELARRSGLRLLRMVDDLLVLSRLEASSLPVHRRNLDLGAIVSMLVDESAPLASRKGIRLTRALPDEPLKVAADPDAVERIFLNLLANALHFTRSGGTVHVRLQSSGAFALLEVVDTGIGIPVDQLESIFDRFHQVPQEGGSHGVGTGIGLSLVRELVNVHGGRIEARSAIGHGTTMSVWMPIQHESVLDEPLLRADADLGAVGRPIDVNEVQLTGEFEASADHEISGMPEWHNALRKTREYRLMAVERATERRRTPRAQRDDGSMPRLLVVEDNVDLVRYIGELLSSTYSVMSATDGPTALRLAHQFVPDLILCDLMLPDMSGFDVIAELRASSVTRHIPVVVLSARQDLESRTFARTRGADAFIGKPFHVSELTATVQGLLERVGLRRDLVRRETHEVTHGLVASLTGSLRGQLQQMRSALDAMVTEGRVPRSEVAAVVVPLENLTERIALVTGGEQESASVTPMNQLIQEAVSSVPVPAGGSVRLTLRTPGRLNVRRSGLSRAIAELMNNVWAFAGERARVIVESEVAPDGSILIRIEDSGPGVPFEQHDRVFQPFFTTRPDVAAGLGLTIVRDVAFAHSGGITVSEGRTLGGAAFALRIQPIPTARQTESR